VDNPINREDLDESEWQPELPVYVEPSVPDGLNRDRIDLGIENAIVINWGSEKVVDIPENLSVEFDLNGGHVIMRSTSPIVNGIDVVLNGVTKNGSLKIYGNQRIRGVRLYLNGADITNPVGPAISFPVNDNISNNIDSVSVNLVGGGGRRNILADGANYAALPDKESAKGTFFSETQVGFRGEGSLEIRSKYRHAIVVDNNFKMTSGNIIIYESVGDGIHVNREILVQGGTLQIKSSGDAIQSEGRTVRNDINISGGKLTLWTTGIKSHGIASDSGDVIIGGSTDIKMTVLGDASKGIRSRRSVNITGGKLDITTYGDIDITPAHLSEDDDATSSAAGVRAHVNFFMSGGELRVKSFGENSKGINVDKNAEILGGAVDIKSHGDGIKVDGDLIITGGKVTTQSSDKKGIDCKGCNGESYKQGGTVTSTDRTKW
jgi:hypothetical protein